MAESDRKGDDRYVVGIDDGDRILVTPSRLIRTSRRGGGGDMHVGRLKAPADVRDPFYGLFLPTLMRE
jgi:hypothetical protein